MHDLFTDIRHGTRVLFKNRSFTAVAVLALALGIGANTAIFSMADAILFHPFSFPDLDRIVALYETIPTVGAERYDVAAANYFDWRKQNRVFDQMAAYKYWSATLALSPTPQRVSVYLVSPDFFALLGVPPELGRVFSAQNSIEEHNEIVVSFGFWQQRLGADPNVVGKRLELNGLGYTVIGVMPREFDFPMYADMWSPWIVTPGAQADRGTYELGVIARLRAGASLGRAQAEMNNTAVRLSRLHPETNAGRGIRVMLLRDTVDEYAGRFIAIITAAVVFLLLLACANVANLQLARGAVRRNEIALRLALGASKARIARQLITEGLILSFLGAALALPLGVWALGIIRINMPPLVARHLPGLAYARLDARMLIFTLATAVLTGVAFTLPAVVQAGSERLHETLKEGWRGPSATGRPRMRSVLVVSEIGLAVVLLTGAGLMVNAFRNLAALNRGFDPSNVVTFNVRLAETAYAEPASVAKFYTRTLQTLQGLSGMQSVAVISELPALSDSRSSTITIEGQPTPPADRPLRAEVRVTSEDYFRTMAIPLLTGRTLNQLDSAGSLPVAVISKRAAQRFWPGQDPLGRRAKLASREVSNPWLTIVGVVGDVNHFYLDSAVRPTIYTPYRQQPIRSLNVVLRTGAPLDAAAGDIRAAMQSLDAAQPISTVERMSRFFSDLAGGVGMIADLMGAFAIIALVLAGAGIYAVMSYSVAQRAREIGIRMALGARPLDVQRLVVGNALRLTGIGLGLGVPGALALSRAMSGVLPGVVALDAFTFAGVTVLLAAIALLASLVPSRRAALVDPLLSLRAE